VLESESESSPTLVNLVYQYNTLPYRLLTLGFLHTADSETPVAYTATTTVCNLPAASDSGCVQCPDKLVFFFSVLFCLNVCISILLPATPPSCRSCCRLVQICG